MIMSKDNDFSCRENEFIEVGTMAVIGDRPAQEDFFGYLMDDSSLLLCVCDGMGGYSGGSAASRKAVESILGEVSLAELATNPAAYLNALTVKANGDVTALHQTLENSPNAGCTVVTIFVKDNLLYWSSVGDSRLYICRKNEFLQITKDQNFYTVLKEKMNAGEISEEEFIKVQDKGDALVNFLGIGELRLIDYSIEPLKLKAEDQLLVCTDGLYRVLDNEEITVLLNAGDDITTTLQKFELTARKNAKDKMIRRDNMTVSIVKVK